MVVLDLAALAEQLLLALLDLGAAQEPVQVRTLPGNPALPTAAPARLVVVAEAVLPPPQSPTLRSVLPLLQQLQAQVPELVALQAVLSPLLLLLLLVPLLLLLLSLVENGMTGVKILVVALPPHLPVLECLRVELEVPMIHSALVSEPPPLAFLYSSHSASACSLPYWQVFSSRYRNRNTRRRPLAQLAIYLFVYPAI